MTHQQIFEKAVAEGMQALKATVPQPMTVYSADLEGNQIGPSFYVPEGPCGFAEVRIKGNTSFGRWASKTKAFDKSIYGGLYYWVSEGNQSVDRKAAFAQAMARVLNDNGIPATWTSRLD